MDFSGELDCALTLELFSNSGEVIKRTISNAATVALGRNEFKEIMIKIRTNKKNSDHIEYSTKNIIVHRRFANEGKATLVLSEPNKVNFFLSNCPPQKLLNFLKVLTIKNERFKLEKKIITSRERLITLKPHSFEEISPLSVADVNALRTLNNQTSPINFIKANKNTSKRCFIQSPSDKENIRPSKVVAPSTNRRICYGDNFSKGIRPSIISLITEEQQKVLNIIETRQNIFFSGSAGTGKSYLLRRIIGSLPPENTFITASTGLAACQIGGMTLHAFAGIGNGEDDIERCLQLAMRQQITQQWKQCEHLIIDEISMVDGAFFQKLDIVARTIRKVKEPFGKIQLVICGDFLQLPPVCKLLDNRLFAFQTNAWRKSINKFVILKQVHRQSDTNFIHILNNIRFGRCTTSMEDMLRKTCENRLDKNGILATRLCTHKQDVDNINRSHLTKLTGELHCFKAIDSCDSMTSVINGLVDLQPLVELKIGAQVMMTKNLDLSRGLVNGARGVVVGFESSKQGYPIVEFVCGVKAPIGYEKSNVKVQAGAICHRSQIPLKLAWALSIHKSQGMTLDCVEISLSRVFEPGQAYVALSRARSLEGLRVIDFDRSCVRADPVVTRFYEQLSQQID